MQSLSFYDIYVYINIQGFSINYLIHDKKYI